MRLFSYLFSILTVAVQRLWNQRLLMLCLLAGLLAAVGLLTSIPLYADAVQNRLLQGELTDAGTFRPPFAFLWRYVGAWHGDVTWEAYQPVNQYLLEQAPAVVDLPITEQIRHVSSARLRLYPVDDSNFNLNEPLFWTNVGFITQLEPKIRLLEGAFPSSGPSDEVEVLVSEATAVSLGLQVGEQFVLFGPGSSNIRIQLRIAGIWLPLDATDPFWFYQPEAFREMLLTSEGQFAQQLVPQLAAPVSTAVWYQIYDGGHIRPSTVDTFLQQVRVVEARTTALLNNTTLDASPVSALQNYGQANNLLTLTLTIFSVPIISLILYFISLIAAMVIRRDQSEIATLRSRGARRGQIVTVYLLEGLLIGGLGLAGGLVLGLRLAQLMGQTRTFLDPGLLDGRDFTLTPVLAGAAWQYAFAALLLVIIALIWPAYTASRYTIVTMRQQQARALQKPLWQRFYLDFLLLILPLYGWYQLARQGSIGILGGNDPFANPLLFLVPILFCFALALVAIRFFPLLMQLLAWLAGYLPGITLLLILRQLARAAAQYTGPLLLLSLTVSLAVFTASMAITLDDHLAERIYYQVGADLNLAELGENIEEDGSQPGQPSVSQGSSANEPRWLFLPVNEHLYVEGVQAAARVGQYQATSNIGGRQENGRILGLDRLDFPHVAYYRPDFASHESLGGLMNRLAVSPDHLLVSRNFMTRHNLRVGDPLPLTIGAGNDFTRISFTIAAPLDLFPTQYPHEGPFFVANLDYLHEGLGGAFPYNVWLKTDPDVPSQQIISGARQLGFTVITARDAREVILAEQTRPERQGLFGLLSVGFIAAALLTVLGFLVYAINSFQQRFIQLGMLRAIGLSIGQMAAYLAGEQALLILAGIGLGTGFGVWASRIFIPFLQVGADRAALIPPFVVQIAWQQVSTIYLLFGVMFVTAVIALTALLIRMRLFEAVKLGETV